MELICEKYQDRMVEAEALCLHLEEYCQFRKACIVNFLTRERQREARRQAGISAAPEDSGLPADSSK